MKIREKLGLALIAAAMILAAFRAGRLLTQKPRALTPEPPPIPARQLLPTGMAITPLASAGSYFIPLDPGLPGLPDYRAGQPVTEVKSPDGKTLLVLTSGYNRFNSRSGREIPADSEEYAFLFDISGTVPRQLQALRAPNTFDGAAWSPDGREFYVSGGCDDDVHVFSKQGGVWAENGATISLGHAKGLGIDVKPEAAGLAVTPSGQKLVVTNFENDSVSVIDLKSRRKIAELDLRPGKINPRLKGVPGGEFPFWVAIRGDDRAYVSSPRDRQIVVVDISGAAPKVTRRIALPGEPNKMIFNRAQSLLFAALGTDDAVAVVDARADRLLGVIGTTAPKSIFANLRDLKGSNPNGLALSPDEKTLYVSNGGANSVAVIKLADRPKAGAALGQVAGLVPTAWYPSAVSVSPDGQTLYVANTHSVPGPNPGGCRGALSTKRGSLDACRGQNQFILQLSKGGFEAVPVPSAQKLAALTMQVADNDHYVPDARRAADAAMMAFLHGRIKHVIYIIKENRTYDQMLGDLPEGNGDPSLAVFPRPLTPNQHQLALDFVDMDNFYDSGEVSGNGWNWSTAARATQMVEATIPLYYAGRGLSYDYEGGSRNINVGFATLAARRAANPATPDDPNLLPGTADVDAPDGPDGEAGMGYLWDAALRAKLSVRNYGFFLDLSRYYDKPGDPGYLPLLTDPHAAHVRVAFPTKPELMAVTDPYFRGFDLRFPDYWRFKEWDREFRRYRAQGRLPNLEMVRLMRDHTGEFGQAIERAGTLEDEVSDNDYAVGLVAQAVANSPFRDNTLIFVVEDDAQNGPDHVDAHRSLALVIGPYVKRHAVVSTHYTTVNLLSTIEGVLGLKPLGINDAVEEPMADAFTKALSPWSYAALVPEVLRATALPLPPETPAEKAEVATPEGRLYAASRHAAAYWAAKTRGFDFEVEDKINSALFNRIVWRGMMGEGVPYPTERDGRDLRHHRKELLEKYWAAKRSL